MKSNQHVTMFIMHDGIMVRCVISGEYRDNLLAMGWSESSEDLVKNDTSSAKNDKTRSTKSARITKKQGKE